MSFCHMKICAVYTLLLSLVVLGGLSSGVANAQGTPELTAEQKQAADKLRQRITSAGRQGPDKAAKFYAEVAKEWEETVGRTEDLAILWDSLATASLETFDFATARSVWTKEKDFLTARFGKTDWRTREVQRKLADVDLWERLTPKDRERLRFAKIVDATMSAYIGEKNFDGALVVTNNALDIRKKLLGVDHPDYGLSLFNRALVYQELGDFAKSEQLSLEAKQIMAKTMGKKHPNYLQNQKNLLVTYLRSENPEKVVSIVNEIIQEKSDGDDQLDYAEIVTGMGYMQLQKKEYAKGIALFREAIQIQAKTVGKSHPDYAASLNNLADVYQKMGEYEKATPLYREAMQIRRSK